VAMTAKSSLSAISSRFGGSEEALQIMQVSVHLGSQL
jgi:hypothetical protein